MWNMPVHGLFQFCVKACLNFDNLFVLVLYDFLIISSSHFFGDPAQQECFQILKNENLGVCFFYFSIYFMFFFLYFHFFIVAARSH